MKLNGRVSKVTASDVRVVIFVCCAQGELRISVLPTYLSYDAPWPVRKIPLRCTVHYVSYHVESKASLLLHYSAKQITSLRHRALNSMHSEVLLIVAL